MSTLADDILAYLNYLRGLGLCVSVHDDGRRLSRYMQTFSPYLIHGSPYCMLIKTSREAWGRCRTCQSRVLKKCAKGSFRGTCYAGVEELVFPIGDSSPVGFVCVSGYRADPIKVRRRILSAASRYGFDPEILQRLYGENFTETAPEMGDVSAVIMPLCRMLEMLFSVSNPTDGGGSTADYVLGHILAYLRQHFAEPVTLDEVCAFCHYSRSYVSHLFEARTGYSLSGYVNLLRMEEAKELLLRTSLGVGDIAAKVGFSDSNYFSNTFRRYCGCSPRAFRKSHGLTQG